MMETLASILAGAGANPYQGNGGGMSPLIQQLMLAQQMGGPQLGQTPAPGMPGMPAPMPIPGQPVPGQPPLPGGMGRMGALQGIPSGAY